MNKHLWKSRSKVSKVFTFVVLFGASIAWVGNLGTEPAGESADVITRAPRSTAVDSTCTSGFVSCAGCAELDSISNCICAMKTEITEDFQETWTILGSTNDVFASDQEILESTVNTYTLSIIGWLKTLYALHRGWTV